MDSEILTLQVDINDDPMNQKVDAIEKRLSTLQKDAKQVAEGVTPSTESLPGYNDAFMRKLADWERSLTDIGRTRSSMEHAMSSYEQNNLSTSYKRKVEVANRSIKDLANSQTLVSELLNSFGPGMSQVFSKGLEGIVSQLSTGIRTTAASISNEVSRKLTDDEIVDRYMRSGEYGRIVQKLNKTHPDASKVYTPQNMRQYLMANVPMSVPQYMREAITGGSQVPILKQPESYREMLPKSFQKIEPHAERGQVRQLGQISHANETLSTDEISALGRIVRNNRYAADAAVKAGIISKSGQKIYFNHAANHDMMDAMAGFIMDDMTRAAQGERKYGIDNVENPNFWKNISNKRGSNKVLDGTLAAAYAMHDAFGSWLNPGRFGTGFTPFDATSSNAEYLGRINHSPRKTSRAFAEYTLDMMQNGAQISGMHPIVQGKNGSWTELSHINGPVSAKNSPTGRAITPDDFHTISMNDSLLYKMVMSSPNAKRVGQNGFSDNMFYLKFSDELGDPGLTKERRAELQQQYADLFRNGYKVNGEDYIRTRISKTHAEFMKAAIVDDIGRKALGMEYARPGDQPLDEATAAKVRKAGLDALSNGGYSNGHSGHFDTFKPFAKTMYNQNNMATEGESLATWLGTTFGFSGNDTTAKMIRQGMGENERQRIMADFGTPNMKVVVGSFGKADMDGSNWISDRVSNKGFQGRTFNGKATYVPINMMDMRARNFQQVEMTEEAQQRVAEINAQAQKDIEEANRTLSGKKLTRRLNSIESRRAKNEAYAVAQLGGDWIIPGAGINGNDLRVSKDTDVIEDINNIKNFKTHYQDDVKSGKITQEQMNEIRSRDYSRDEIFAKTTYDDANTSSRLLSKQVINSSMNAGFRDPRVQQYFDKVFFDELAKMDDDQYVRDLLFKGDQNVDLQSEKAQKTINDHIAGMWARYDEGDRLLPTGALKYAMAAPNPQSVINNRLKAAGIELTPEQKALELGDNQVISMESLDKQMGIIRFPATKTGNVTVDNVSAEQLIKSGGASRAQIERLAKSRGIVDTKGLYFAPNSPILKLLQGEDFDGDLNAYFGLSEGKIPKEAKEFSDVMRIIANASDKEVEQIWGAKPGTPEFNTAWNKQDARKAAQTIQSVAKAGGYDLSNPDDAAAFLVNVPREHPMMGAAERSADMAALYYAGLNDPKMRGNLAQAIKDYESQYDVVSTNMKTDESWKRTNEQAYAADLGLSFSRMFKYANDAIQTTGENDESVRVWNGKSQEYLRDKNVDQLGLPSLFQGSVMGTLMGRMKSRWQGVDPEGGVYNWGQVLDAVKLPEGVSADSEQGKFVQMMRGVRKDFLESKYLVASNQTVDALQEQYEKAVGEIESSIDPTSPEGRALKKERLKAIGAQAFDNFKQYGATERNLANATWTQASLEDFAKQNGVSVDQLVGNAGFVAGVQAAVQASEPEKTFQRPEAAKNVTVTTSKTHPEGARIPSEQKTAQEMLAQETPQQQAQRLLKEAGVRNRNTILDANQRDALVEAVANNDLSALMKLNGVGKKNAPKIMAALQGSSLLELKTTSPEEMQKAVTEAIAPKLAQKEKPDEKTSASSTTTNNVPNNQPSQYGNTVPSWGGFPGVSSTPPGGPPSPPSGGNPWDKQAAQSYYGQLWDKAQAFSGKLFGETLNYENKNKGEFSSISRAKQNDAIAARYEQQIKDFQASDDYKYLLEEQKRNLDILVSPKNGLVAKAGRDFSEMSMYSSSQLLENIGTAEQKASGTYDAQLEALNKWDEKIKEVEADQKRLLAMSSDPKYSKDLQNQFKQSADKIGDDLTRINTSRQNLGAAIQDQNQKAFNKQIEGLESRLHPGNKYQQQSRQYNEQINSIRENLTKKHDAGLISDASFSKDISRLDELEKKSSTSALAINNAFKTVGTSISRSITNLASRFGRQLFQKALTEAKKFVQEFDKSMTSIQMITLKSDEQMSTLGDSLIAKAKELKISVAEITQSAETLYRQGLSDEEVNERLDVISKFSKVSGTKVDAATKLITIAMNTGLVGDPQVAADIVTALGDNAATNASEIEKGIEKAGAAAAADGTTFAQLASMLTAITSTTQIGGNVAGRTLNTIFGRMNKIGTNELIYDENGHAISGSAVAQLLAAQGIKMYDENGNKRSSYDTLYALSQRWDNMTDAEQQRIANAIAGTRQYSNFAAIMQGMVEGKVDEYMSLTEGSSGIVDNKYEIYVKSLQASLTDLKNTFDELVHDLTDSGALSSILNFFTGMIKGVDNLTNSFGGLGAVITTVLPMLIGLSALKVGLTSMNVPAILAGLGLLGASSITLSAVGSQRSAQEEYQSRMSDFSERQEKSFGNVTRLKELRNQKFLSEDDKTEYATLIHDYAQNFGMIKSPADEATYSIKNLSSNLSNFKGQVDGVADTVIKEATKLQEQSWMQEFLTGETKRRDSMEAQEKTIDDENRQKVNLANPNLTEKFFNYDSKTGTYSISANAEENLKTVAQKRNISKAGGPIGLAYSLMNQSNGTDDTIDSLAGLLHIAARGHGLDDIFGEDMSVLDEKDWKDVISGTYKGGLFSSYFAEDSQITMPILQAVLNVLNGTAVASSPTEDNIQKYKQSFLSNHQTMLSDSVMGYTKEQIDYLADQYAQMRVSGMSSKEAEDAIYGTNYDIASTRESIDAILKNAPLEEVQNPEYNGKVTYKGSLYNNEQQAKETQDIDFEEYKKNNKISELSYVPYDERGWVVGRDEADLAEKRNANRQNYVDENIDALIERSRKNGQIFNGQLKTEKDVSNMFTAFQAAESSKINEPIVYSYVDSNGKETISTDKADVEKARYFDYSYLATDAAQKAGEFQNLIDKYGSDVGYGILEWYESQHGNPTYDDFTETHRFGEKQTYEYNGISYNTKQEAEQARMDDFYSGFSGAQEYYEIGDTRYTSKVDAIKGGREYLQRQWEEKNPIGEVENVFTYKGNEYNTREEAEIQQKKDFYEAEENAIRAATEEEVDFLDPIHSGAEFGLDDWRQKNAYALRADKMRRNLEAAGVNDAASLENYLKTEGTVDWKYLTENNGEFARLVDSLQFDTDGNIINPGVYDQIITFLRTNGRDLGAPVRSTTQKATMAQDMFKHLTEEQPGYLSVEEARDAAQRQYETEQAEYESNIQRLTDERISTLTGDVSDEIRAKYEAEVRKANPYTGQTAEQIAAGYRVYTEDEQAYLKEAVGEQIYDKLISAREPGTEVDQEIATYAGRLLSNKASGISGLTTADRLAGIQEIRNRYNEFGLDSYDKDVAKQYLSGWANAEEYLALASKEGLKPEEAERFKALQASLDEFQQETQIKFDVEGVQALENAGKVADGTASKLERLKKGGDIALRVSYEIQNEAYGTAQLGARLSGGTREEQIEAIKSLTGYTDAQIQKMGFENALADANVLFNSKNNLQISSLEELYSKADTDEEKAIIDRIANNAGYGNQYDENGNVIAGKYTLKDNPVDREDRFFNAKQLFQATTIANAQKEILAGTLTADTFGREQEYETAADRMGEQGTEYLRMLRSGKYSQKELDDQLVKANAEADKMIQDAADQDALKEAELNNASLGGMFNYLQTQHSQQNKASVAAEEIFGSLSEDKIKNFTDLATSVNGEQADNWKKLLEATPDLANKLSQLGVKVDDSGNIDFSKVEASGYNLADVLDLLSSAAANAAESITDYNVESTGEKYENAMAYLSGEEVVDPDAAFASLSNIYGNEAIAQVVAHNRATVTAGYNNLREENGYLIDSNGDRYQSREEYFGANYNKYEGLTEYNRKYAETLEENAQSGQTGLTDIQRAEFLQEIVSAANLRQSADVEGSLGWLRNQDKVGAWQDITSGVEGVDKWLAASERLNEHGMSMEDLANLEEGSEQWNIANEAVKDYYGSVEGAQEAQKEMDRQLATESIRLTQRFGDQTSTVADKMKKLSGSIQEQDEVLSEMTTNWDNYNKSVYVKNQFENGSTNWSDVTSILGGSDNLWKNTDRDVVLAKLNAKVEVNEQEVINDTNAKLNSIISEITPEQMQVLSPLLAEIDPTMSYNLGTLSALAEQCQLLSNEIIQNMISSMGEVDAEVKFDVAENATGDGWTIKGASTTGVSAANNNTGYSGGGGGGGESEASKLKKKLDFYESEKKHVTTMLTTKETALDFTNNFLGWAHNLDEQIEAQDALAEQYRSNLAELTDELSSVEEYSDDWYTLTSAIMTTEEALAGVENEINSINAKRITIVESKQEIEDKPQTHALTMLQKYASRYQTNDNFESYKAIMQKSIEQSQAEIDQNNAQIAEWEELLATYQENSDSWNDVRDKIWAIKEENAELENQMASDTISLQEAEISQIAADLENSQRFLNHENAMFDTYGGMYQSIDNQARYRQVLEDTNANNEELKKSTDEAIEQVKAQINSMKESDPARKTAIQTLYELEETSAKYEASILSNRQAIEESFINELSRNYGDNSAVFEHELKLLNEAEKEFLRNDDLVNYENILDEKVRNTTERLENQEAALAAYLELQNSGKITEGSQQWKSLEETIRSTKESIAALKNEQAETLTAFQKAQFEDLQTRYREGVAGEYEGMDQLQHEQTLINYEQTKYQNRGELTNYGTALGWEKENLEAQREAIQRQIEAVKELQETHKDNPEIYKKETEMLRKLEEELSKNTNAIEKNEEAQKKNQIAILSTTIAVQKTADTAIRELIQKERNMLSATVNVQNTILETIRQNYQEQWNLEKQTLNKKKQALAEEKNLISERLNFRKKMMNEEAKEEELAEYKRQLALISADTTRTKDANELRRKINEMERDMAIQTAEDIANAEIKSNEEKAQSIDNYIAVYEEDLNNLLKNSNNFREELDSLMSGSFEDFVAWNAKYNERYKYATDEQREQMVQGWDDTWYEMLGMLRLYWDQVDEVSRTKEGWLALATSTDAFQSLSAEDQQKRLIELQDQYDAMEKARIDNATFDDEHQMLNKIDELKNWTFNVRLTGIEDYVTRSGYSNYVYNRDTNTYEYQPDTDYAGVGKTVSYSYSGGGGGGGDEDYGSSSSDSGSGSSYTPSNKNVAKDNNTEDHLGSSLYDLSGMIGSAISTAVSTASYGKAKQGTTGGGLLMQTELTKNNGSISKSIVSDDDNEIWKNRKYASGGLVDYTGLAWVDGTKTRPESFLDATDTALLRGMLDAFDYVKTTPYMTHVEDVYTEKPSVNIGDVNVNLYEAKLEDDADYEAIARKVGSVFTKELQKGGMNLAGYAW